MKRWLQSAMLLCVVSLPSPRALAFVEDPYITPARPTPDTPISVHVRMGWCHASWEDVDEAELMVAGPGQLQLITDGVALPPGHPFCIHPPFTYRFDIGPLPAGAYTLQFFVYDNFVSREPIGFGSVSFLVASPASIPTSSWVALAIITALVVAAGLFAVAFAQRDQLSQPGCCAALIHEP